MLDFLQKNLNFKVNYYKKFEGLIGDDGYEKILKKNKSLNNNSEFDEKTNLKEINKNHKKLDFDEPLKILKSFK